MAWMVDHSVAKDQVNEEEKRKCRVLLHYYLITFIDYEESSVVVAFAIMLR